MKRKMENGKCRKASMATLQYRQYFMVYTTNGQIFPSDNYRRVQHWIFIEHFIQHSC